MRSPGEACDRIIVRGIQFYGSHGVSDEEQAVGHRYSVDIEVATDLRSAGRTDSIEDTINYAAIVRLALEIGTSTRFRLMEALAQRIADAVLERFRPDEVRVRVKKLLPPVKGVVKYAAVEILRVSGSGED
jgi:dihydroneopterin aldolase